MCAPLSSAGAPASERARELSRFRSSSPCAGAARLDHPLWIVPNKALSLTHTHSLYHSPSPSPSPCRCRCARPTSGMCIARGTIPRRSSITLCTARFQSTPLGGIGNALTLLQGDFDKCQQDGQVPHAAAEVVGQEDGRPGWGGQGKLAPSGFSAASLSRFRLSLPLSLPKRKPYCGT